MIRLAFLICLALVSAARAQDAATAILRVDFPETRAIPGQPLSLRLTVLVPTFMPQPPVWPSLEAPNLLVRLPEGATNPTSERVEGETWSGITRHYRISPMVPGDFSIPPQEVIVTWADPQTNEPIQASLTTEPLAFSGTIPTGAEGLNPFIAADTLEFTQEIAGDPSAMSPGDSVTRTVTATISGTSPMFLPRLLPPATIEGVAAYPDDPVLEEHDDRGEISGTRVENVTYLGQGGGRGEAPPVALDWYDLGDGQVKTASLDGVSLVVDGPPAAGDVPRDWRKIAGLALGTGLVLVVAALILRNAIPRIAGWLRRRRETRLASEAHAYRVLRQVISERNLARLYSALDGWAGKCTGRDPRDRADIQDLLTRIGAGRYGRMTSEDRTAWPELDRAVRQARKYSSPAPESAGSLPRLNPGHE